ncbi:SNF7 family protein [Pyricularia oryzae 70-15]|uniref:SNF7 family protein n=3 Tax=Pyricularia oryzae TaxID=318829 RepID=G4NFA2_PYRO7|nr:SNF7 family protein [Pyricularia oryzae 70-15]EHA47284.1 SNF7 family protein [Pyricularia oryzae 70-15]ELQ41074.1 SNF7 family protein [Pyricularia oryzae Y34]KAI7929172.1 SNF7 family protein [Pyricularia oryzae]KAI7930073.1 SNF7 family protein [Pyricularia oryzae]
MGDIVEYLCQNEPSFRKARLPALYSDFIGQRASNPDGYAANVSAWRRALATVARSGLVNAAGSGSPNTLVLVTDESLVRALESRQYGRPLALGVVVQEAIAAGDLIPLKDFLSAKQSIYDKSSSWGALPLNVVSWGFRQLGAMAGLGGPSEKMPKAQLVVVANLELAAKAFGEKTADASSRFERTWSKPHFLKTVAASLLPSGPSGPMTLSPTDVDVLLTFLSRDKDLVVYDGNTIRMKDATGQESSMITQEDVAIAQLKELREYLGHQTRILERRIEDLAAAAKDAVAKKNRVSALAALKSKKLAETSLASRFATLSQLEEVASRIEQAADQVQLVKVMDTSTEALRGLNEQIGGVERVEDVVDRLREQMDAVDEVGTILAESGPGLDEGELDDELAALEGEEKKKEEETAERMRKEAQAVKEAQQIKEAEELRQKLNAIGEVPTSLPGTNNPAITDAQREDPSRLDSVERDTVEVLTKLSLEEDRQAQPAV